MKLVKWEWQAFLFKFIGVQGGAIIAALRSHNSDPWSWAEILFYGIVLSLGVDTATWMVASAKENKKEKASNRKMV